MKQLIYVSQPTKELTPFIVQDILRIAHEVNAQNNISGLLICDGEYFLQCIEGDDHSIDQLYYNICKDDRHHNIKLIGAYAIDQKDFKEWDMGYVSNPDEIKVILTQETSTPLFDPYSFSFTEAKSILKSLIPFAY